MAAHVVVTDSSFRPTKVKVSPVTNMTDIRDEACRKLNLDPSKYGLKNKTKPVDLSLNFRQTGLSSGAKLDLIPVSKSPGVVSVALQIPDSSGPGRRLIDKFPSNTTFWQVLRKFESTEGTNLNFTARGVTEVANGSSGAGRIFYEMPNLRGQNNQEFVTFGDLQRTIVGGLGVNSGSVLVRLTFKKTEQPLEEAMAEIGQYFKSEEEAQSGATGSETTPVVEVEGITEAIAKMDSAEPSGEDTDMKDQTTAVLGDSLVTPSKRPAPVTPEEAVLGPNQRPISIYAAPSSAVPKAALQPHNEDDYEPTIAHAKLHQSRLLNRSQNQRLLGDAELDQLGKEKAEKLATMKKVEIKLRFPDQTTTVVSFTAEETAGFLYDFVKNLIAAEDQPFKLVWNGKGPQTVPRDKKSSEKKLIKDLGLEGRVVINLVWEDGASESARKAPTLKQKYADKAREVAVPEVPEVEAKAEDVTPTVDKGKGKENSEDSGGKGKGIPKWLKGLSRK